jgi:hypothetical protein
MRRILIAAVTLLVLVVGGTGAAASVSYAGSWQGATGQGKVIKFHVTTGNQIDSASVSMTIVFSNCSGSTTFTTTNPDFDPPFAITNAKFKFTMGSNPKTTVMGSFASATAASGSMTGTFSDPITGCKGTKTTTWTAHHV